MERASSDDKDDRETLIEQNDTKHHHPHPPTSSPRLFTLHIDDELGCPLRRRFNGCNLSFNKRYLFAMFLPLVIVLVFFFMDIQNLFSTHLSTLNLRSDSLSERMRESELRALYLLRQQQRALFSLWSQSFSYHINDTNRSTSNSNSTANSTVNSAVLKNFDSGSDSALLEDFESALLEQISFNKEIQQVLLSPHKSGNVSTDFDNASCRKLDQGFSDRKIIEWKPESNKFLFAVCLSGQMSNHLICLEKHMFFAALLNRVLVIPSSKFDYHYSRVIDIEHINDCLGRKVVVTFEEFMETKNHLHIDRFICYFSLPTPCYVDEDHITKLKGLGISMGKLESPWKEDIRKPSKRTLQDVEAKFASNDDVIAIGDVFYADVEQEWVMQPGGPIAHKCKTLVEPSKVIVLTAHRFIQTFLGKNFIALHFRRHGFLKFCNAKKPSCFFPIPQAADCITRVVESANAPAIYLSTDAAESETGLLQSLVVVNGKTIPLVKRPPRSSAEKWDALLYRHGLDGDSQVEAMLDKTICAMSSVFIGTSGSTFTEDILRLRKDWQSASSCDEYLCEGELPNFVAENE